MAHDVFISYSARDKTTADAACATLEAAGLRCWVAPRDVTPGASWAGEIVQAIRESKVLLLVFSADSNKSQQVAREVERAVSVAIPIIPFRIEDVVPTDAMEYYLGSHHWLDAMTPPLQTHLERLAMTIKTLVPPDLGTPLSTERPETAKPSALSRRAPASPGRVRQRQQSKSASSASAADVPVSSPPAPVAAPPAAGPVDMSEPAAARLKQPATAPDVEDRATALYSPASASPPLVAPMAEPVRIKPASQRPSAAAPVGGEGVQIFPWYRSVPGFRSATSWKRVVAIIAYVAAALWTLLLLIAGFNTGKWVLSFNLFGLIVLGIGIVAVDGWHLRSRSPLIGSASKGRAIVGWLLFAVGAIVILFLLTLVQHLPKRTPATIQSQVLGVATSPVAARLAAAN